MQENIKLSTNEVNDGTYNVKTRNIFVSTKNGNFCAYINYHDHEGAEVPGSMFTLTGGGKKVFIDSLVKIGFDRAELATVGLPPNVSIPVEKAVTVTVETVEVDNNGETRTYRNTKLSS